MVVPLSRVVELEAMLRRVVDRFHMHDGATMPQPQWKAYRAWQRSRYNDLNQEYAAAINSCDQIIGKAWHYDHMVPRLPPEHGAG